MSFRFLKWNAKRTGATIAALACAVGAQALFLPAAHAEGAHESVTVKEVGLGRKIAKNGTVETKESVVFAAPKSIKGSDMRYAQIAWYKAEGKSGEIVTKADLNKLVSKYLSEKGYKNFDQAFPLQSELKLQKFIFSPLPAPQEGAKTKSLKARLLKTDQAFASYLEKLCEKNKIPSSPIPLTYSPTHPAAVAPLEAGGYLFYSSKDAFLPQVVFTTGEKIKNLKQSDFVKLNPVPAAKKTPEKEKGKEEKKAAKAAREPKKGEKGKSGVQGRPKAVRKETEPAKEKSEARTNQEKRVQTPKGRPQRLQAAEKPAFVDYSAPMVHVLDTGLNPPDYLWSENGTWITNPEGLSFSVGEMNPISYQVETRFPKWQQMGTLYVYPSASFDFTVTPGYGESVMLNTLQVGGVSLNEINGQAGADSVMVTWGGQEVSNLNQSVEGNGEKQLEVSLYWPALHYLRWSGEAVNDADGSSAGYGNLSIYHDTYFALDFIGYLNLDATGSAEGVSTSASISGVQDFDIPYTSPQSSTAVYTNGSPNGSGQIGASFALKPEKGLNNADSYGNPTSQTTNAGLWWKEEAPKGSCNGEITKGAEFTVATLADTLYTGPGSTPSSGDMLSNGKAYLEPAGGEAQNPLATGPSGSDFAGWSFGPKPVEYSSVYAGAPIPSLQNNSGLFEIGGVKNGVYIVSQTVPADNSSSLPSFYITVSHGSPNSYSDANGASRGMLDASAGTLQVTPFCKMKSLPITGGSGAASFLIPAATLIGAGGAAYVVCLWINRKKSGKKKG